MYIYFSKYFFDKNTEINVLKYKYKCTTLVRNTCDGEAS